MSEKPSTLSVVLHDRKLQDHTPANRKSVSTGGIANCQLMFDSSGALFEFPMPPKSSPVYVGRKAEYTDNATNIDLTHFNAYDSGVSRTHARFERAGKRLFLRDLNSTNGTRLNGKRLTPMDVHEIHHGDKIEFGRLSAQFYIKS